MTDNRVVDWYDQPCADPRVRLGDARLWVGGSGLNIVLDAVFH